MSDLEQNPAPEINIPDSITSDMKGYYVHEVRALMREIHTLKQACNSDHVLTGDRLLKSMQIEQTSGHACDVLAWMIDEIENILALQAGAIHGIPDYASSAMHELLDKCHEKLQRNHLFLSPHEIEMRIMEKRAAGAYVAEAELAIVSRDICPHPGSVDPQEGAAALAKRLEQEDYARLMAHSSPEVVSARKQLGPIHDILAPTDAEGFFAEFASMTRH